MILLRCSKIDSFSNFVHQDGFTNFESIFGLINQHIIAYLKVSLIQTFLKIYELCMMYENKHTLDSGNRCNPWKKCLPPLVRKYEPLCTLLMIIGKSFVVFLPHLHINCVALALHRIKLLSIKIIDNAGRKKQRFCL